MPSTFPIASAAARPLKKTGIEAKAVMRTTASAVWTLLHTALAVVLITALASIPVFFSGRAAADAIGKVEGIDQRAIDPHEEAAERFLFVAEAAGLAAVAALLRPGRTTISVATVLTLLALGLAGWTAERGGCVPPHEVRQRARIRSE